MADSPVENPGTPDYPHEMETRVAILEHSTAELKYEIREVKAMVRDLTNTVLAKFDATDRSISDLRVEVQSVRTEVQTVRTEVQAGLLKNVIWTVGIIVLLGLPVLGLLGKIAHVY